MKDIFPLQFYIETFRLCDAILFFNIIITISR